MTETPSFCLKMQGLTTRPALALALHNNILALAQVLCLELTLALALVLDGHSILALALVLDDH